MATVRQTAAVDLAKTDASPSIEQACKHYLAAWSARDVDAILALHARDTQYWYRAGRAPAVGHDAIRAEFTAIFRRLPDFAFHVHRVLFGPNHWVLDWSLRIATLGLAGKPVSVSIDYVDVVTVDTRGFVTRKDTYVDARQMRAAITRIGLAKLLYALTSWWPRFGSDLSGETPTKPRA